MLPRPVRVRRAPDVPRSSQRSPITLSTTSCRKPRARSKSSRRRRATAKRDADQDPLHVPDDPGRGPRRVQHRDEGALCLWRLRRQHHPLQAAPRSRQWQPRDVWLCTACSSELSCTLGRRAIILAAGSGCRDGARPTGLGRSMVEYVHNCARAVGSERLVVVSNGHTFWRNPSLRFVDLEPNHNLNVFVGERRHLAGSSSVK
jgi:hypothetical protein